jgi:uncharacterized protein (TIGR03086 family)
MTKLVKAHRRVLKTTVDLVDQVQLTDLDRPTPCAGWDLRQLLAHMIGQNYGFAAAAEGEGADLAAFADRPVGEDPAADYSASADRVIAAFRQPRLAGEYVAVAALRGGVTLPGQVMMGAHLVDYVVHGWDVAKTLDVPVAYDDKALKIALEVAEAVPDRARSDDPGTPFGPTVATSSSALLDQIVANLGRSPDWSAP